PYSSLFRSAGVDLPDTRVVHVHHRAGGRVVLQLVTEPVVLGAADRGLAGELGIVVQRDDLPSAGGRGVVVGVRIPVVEVPAEVVLAFVVAGHRVRATVERAEGRAVVVVHLRVGAVIVDVPEVEEHVGVEVRRQGADGGCGVPIACAVADCDNMCRGPADVDRAPRAVVPWRGRDAVVQ